MYIIYVYVCKYIYIYIYIYYIYIYIYSAYLCTYKNILNLATEHPYMR